MMVKLSPLRGPGDVPGVSGVSMWNFLLTELKMGHQSLHRAPSPVLKAKGWKKSQWVCLILILCPAGSEWLYSQLDFGVGTGLLFQKWTSGQRLINDRHSFRAAHRQASHGKYGGWCVHPGQKQHEENLEGWNVTTIKIYFFWRETCKTSSLFSFEQCHVNNIVVFAKVRPHRTTGTAADSWLCCVFI